MESVPVTIVGSGICGVLTARALKMTFPNWDVILIDKETFAGHHNTTRNSGVLHAGIYYKTGSLKHRLCVSGLNHWNQLAKTYSIPLLECGKYVIATSDAEKKQLWAHYKKAQENGVRNLRKMTAEDKREIADYTHVEDGFCSPHTGILDISSGIKVLHAEIEKLGVIVLMGRTVNNLVSQKNHILVQTTEEEFHTQNLINCGGTGSVDLRKTLQLNDIENYFVKGNYLKLNKPYYNRRLIYPVPPQGLKGLGVHTSFHTDRIVRFGPNTEDVDGVDYENSERNIELMFPSIAETFRNVSKEDLSVDYVGVRTKIIRKGTLYGDFLVQGPTETKIPGYYEALGIESPGMTAAPAIAERFVKMIKQDTGS